LRFKPIQALSDIHSARIGVGYRALGRIRNEGIVWFWIGTHADYDAMLKKL
jgi:hypothetical protein